MLVLNQKELDRRLPGFFKIDIGMRCEVIGTQHIGLTGMLHAQLRPIKGKALALHFAPDLFSGREMRVGLTELQRQYLHGNDGPHRGQPVLVVVEAVRDMSPVTTRSRVGKG